MEVCDVLDETGVRTGRTVVRGTGLPRGEYYPAVHVWIRCESGEYLIQQRALHLTPGPGVWATTAGYVLAGESSVSGAIRETEEELGIRLPLACLARLDRLRTGDRIEDLWLAEVPVGSLSTPGPEVHDWKWASKDELGRMAERGEFFSYSYLDAPP